MQGERSENDSGGRVLPFVRPGAAPRPRPFSEESAEPVEDVGKYESGAEDPEEFRRRQVANAAAFVACILLVLAGVWIAVTMADLQRNQDCVLAGRKNCAQISIVGSPGR